MKIFLLLAILAFTVFVNVTLAQSTKDDKALFGEYFKTGVNRDTLLSNLRTAGWKVYKSDENELYQQSTDSDFVEFPHTASGFLSIRELFNFIRLDSTGVRYLSARFKNVMKEKAKSLSDWMGQYESEVGEVPPYEGGKYKGRYKEMYDKKYRSLKKTMGETHDELFKMWKKSYENALNGVNKLATDFKNELKKMDDYQEKANTSSASYTISSGKKILYKLNFGKAKKGELFFEATAK